MTVSKEECQSNIKTMSEKIDEVKDKIQRLEVNIVGLPKKIIDEMDDKYVSKDSFFPIQKLVYGLVGAVLIAVIGGVMALIMK
jgi:hypothetical protein